MNINISIEARMTSSRLPGKVLKNINGLPTLELMYERIKNIKSITNIIIATTVNKEDDVIITWCKSKNIKYFRGSENNVYERILQTHQKYKSDVIIELTGDCPLIDPTLIEEALQVYLNNNYDYVSNVLTMTYPIGMTVQVYNLNTLKSISTNRELDYQDKEHVTPHLYTTKKYKIYGIQAPESLHMPELSVTLDTIEDFQMIETICKHFNRIDFSLLEIVNYIKKNRELLSINSDIKRKGLN